MVKVITDGQGDLVVLSGECSSKASWEFLHHRSLTRKSGNLENENI